MTEKPQTAEISWAVEEFGQVDLKDERLNFRCQELVEALGRQPTARSIKLAKIGQIARRRIDL